MLPKIVLKTLPGPKTKAVVQRDDEIMSPSYTRSYPLAIVKGKGAMVYGPDGNIFLDFAAGIAVCSTGHSHPKVVKAITEQAKKFIHMSGTDFYYEVQLELGERLMKKVPISGKKKVFWTNSGTESIEGAMKLARYKTKRPNYIAFIGAFHGRTLGALSLTCSKTTQRKNFFPLLPQVFHAYYPYCFRCPYKMKHPECNLHCLNFFEDYLFKKVVDPESVAAIFIEPIQGEGGYVPAPYDYLHALRKLCDKYGIMLVADEVQSGMGRTGKMFGLDHSGVSPDIICVAKGIASGMPLGGFISKAETMDWHVGAHASTFGGNPVSCAAGIATMDLLEGSLIENSAKIGAYMKKRLTDLIPECGCIADVRGLGLMIGVEIVKDRETLEPHVELRDKLVYDMFQKGVLLLGCGPNTIRFCPPLLINKKQADYVVDALRDVIKKNGY